MVFHSEVGSGSARATSRDDWLNKRVQFLTSQHVATVAPNAAGTGYAVGDIIRATHASAHLDPRFEVTTISGGGGTGPVTGLSIVSNGAFALQGASAVVNAGGSGYVVGDVLEVQGGTSRCPMKFLVATLTGSAVATVTLYEGGGAYSAAPGLTGAVTVGVGPTGFAGDDACTLDLTMQALITPLTGIATTHDTGAGDDALTVDITLSETGWSIDGRNTNNNTINSGSAGTGPVDQEKLVVLVGDAAGWTNKPYIAYVTFTEDVAGSNEHGGIACIGLLAHNSAMDLSAHTPMSLGLSSETAMDTTGCFSMMWPDTGAGFGTVDFWMAADDTHFREISQVNTAAGSTDGSTYIQHYAGFLDRVGTETENPYPMYIFGSNGDPTSAVSTDNGNNTGLVENRHGTVRCAFWYDTANATWQTVRNADAAASPASEPIVCSPASFTRPNENTAHADNVVRDMLENERSISIFGSDNGTSVTDRKIFNHGDRATPYRNWRWIPGSTPLPFLRPLTIMSKTVSDTPNTDDRLIGNVVGCYWIPSDDGAGSRIVNFSEDYVTVSGARYYVFHNITQITANQYVAFLADV